MTVRYTVIKGSQSGHCCFYATAVDTDKPCEFPKGEYESICECFDTVDAQRIADALNRSVAIES